MTMKYHQTILSLGILKYDRLLYAAVIKQSLNISGNYIPGGFGIEEADSRRAVWAVICKKINLPNALSLSFFVNYLWIQCFLLMVQNLVQNIYLCSAKHPIPTSSWEGGVSQGHSESRHQEDHKKSICLNDMVVAFTSQNFGSLQSGFPQTKLGGNVQEQQLVERYSPVRGTAHQMCQTYSIMVWPLPWCWLYLSWLRRKMSHATSSDDHTFCLSDLDSHSFAPELTFKFPVAAYSVLPWISVFQPGDW